MLGLTSHTPLNIACEQQDAKGDPGAWGAVSRKRSNKGPLGSVCHGMMLPQGGRSHALGRPLGKAEGKRNQALQRTAAILPVPLPVPPPNLRPNGGVGTEAGLSEAPDVETFDP